MNTERVNNGRFLQAIGFPGFLAFAGTRHSELTRLAWFSLLSLVSLGVFIPFDKTRVKVPVNPHKKGYLVYLAFLGCLAFLGSVNQDMAILAAMAALAGLSTQPDGTRSKPMPAPGELSASTL